MPANSGPAASPLGRRLTIVATCVVSLALCCGLAWWQWDRFMSASGTFQNLGYVLQWPLFGLFPAFMFWRIKKLREREQAEQNCGEAPRAEPAEVTVPAPRPATPPRPAPAPAAAEGEDAELAAYNRYLRELHARDQQS
ncbi:hypothetical protein [Amycolatopsis sp. FDAARGOS 1241]|uniref:hypothetical protein n=1 Tax=Amycolatopsis sp. FDAARGOS 1241 TaxID=2778070 RepID=UPI00351C521A